MTLLARAVKSTIQLAHFLELNPDYIWIKALSTDMENVIVGEWGAGETRSGKFKGLKKVGSGGPDNQ